MPSTLNRTRPLNRYSLKKIAELNAEATIRVRLARRCGGFPVRHIEYAYRTEGRFPILRVTCAGGYCESCHRWSKFLDPHEKHFWGRGGKLSLENTIMVCRGCHRKLQNNELKFGAGK